MPGLSLDYGGTPSADTLFRLSRYSPDGPLFPKLEWLHWDVDGAGPALPFFGLFLSPHLRRITFHPSSIDAAAFAQVISALPASLEILNVEFDQEDAEPIFDALSSFICRCGSSLASSGVLGLLSDAATLHLMQLPNLSRWTTDQGPPQSPQHPSSNPSSTSTWTERGHYLGFSFWHQMGRAPEKD